MSIIRCNLLLSEAQLLSFLLWEPLASVAPQAPHRRPLPQASAFVTSSLKLSSRSSSGASFSFLDVGAVRELEDKPRPVPGSRPAHFCSRLGLPPRGDWGPLVSEAPGGPEEPFRCIPLHGFAAAALVPSSQLRVSETAVCLPFSSRPGSWAVLSPRDCPRRGTRSLSCVRLCVTPWTVARQAPLSMGFSRQECWSGLPFPPPGDLPDPGIKPAYPALAGGFFTY